MSTYSGNYWGKPTEPTEELGKASSNSNTRLCILVVREVEQKYRVTYQVSELIEQWSWLATPQRCRSLAVSMTCMRNDQKKYAVATHNTKPSLDPPRALLHHGQQHGAYNGKYSEEEVQDLVLSSETNCQAMKV
jgi:hypothetical protein